MVRTEGGNMYDCLKDLNDIPQGYGDHKVVLMVRDPWTLYAYWEINNNTELSLREDLNKSGRTVVKTILRVYEVNDNENDPIVVTDVDLNNFANNWYINHIDPGKQWMVDIGILCSNGDFKTIVRSNMVKTPSNKMSGICSDEWKCPEELYYKMFAVAGGYDIGKSSMELIELIETHLREWRSSGGVSSRISSGMSLIIQGDKK